MQISVSKNEVVALIVIPPNDLLYIKSILLTHGVKL